MKSKDRIFYFDVLRAFAIIAVIICHVEHFFGPLTTPAQIIGEMAFKDIGMVGVPIFLMINGALLLNREYPNLGNFLKRRFARIIYPFIFWTILILGQFTITDTIQSLSGEFLLVSRQFCGISGH